MIPSKANLVLNIVLVALVCIALRVWHLTVIQHEAKLEEARRPQRKVVVESSKRGTIRDRYNLPLAINKVQYSAAVLYSQFMQVPRIQFETDAQGKKVRHYKRKEYISRLSELLGKELGMDAERIEDLIYSKASYLHQIPFVLKEDLSEKEYYRLKMLEKDWLGIHVQQMPRRYYPMGKVASDIIGYMGAINREEYEAILGEVKTLERYVEGQNDGEIAFLPEGYDSDEAVYQRLKEVQERAYSLNDYIGKAGIEGRFEETLRGFQGKKSYYSDARGNFLREMPGACEPVSGQRLLLSISAELQEYAEQLLILNESIRVPRQTILGKVKRSITALKQPWIKGGAIVALDPNNGEIIAMASHPRYDPNDFIPSGNPDIFKEKRANVRQWLECEDHLAEIWDQKRPLQRDIYDERAKKFVEEELLLSWEAYLDIILPKDNSVCIALEKMDNLARAVSFQKKLEEDPIFLSLSQTYEQVLIEDLIRMVVPAEKFSDELLALVGRQTISFYRNASAAMSRINEVMIKMAKELYHEVDFKSWRKQNEKIFLKEKRTWEKANHKIQKPYLDYFDAEERQQFLQFWVREKWNLLTAFLMGRWKETAEMSPYISHFKTWHDELMRGAHATIEWKDAYLTLQKALKGLSLDHAQEYLQTLRGFHDLDRPLKGRYRHLRRGRDGVQLQKHLAAAFYPRHGYGFGRSQAYRQSATQGSIFKLITAYAALEQRYRKLGKEHPDHRELNPLDMVDQVYYIGNELHLGYDSEGKPLPRYYKGGRLPRSVSNSNGKLDVVKALEVTSNPYFALLAGDVLDSPSDLIKAARNFSYGSKTGVELPGEISGCVPNDVEGNKTGLYSTAIGQHTMVVTPLQTAVMLASIANGGKILQPKIVRLTAGSDGVCPIPAKLKNTVFMPDAVRQMLLEGMRRVVIRTQGESISSLSRLYHNHPEAISDYIELKHQLIGKTSTAESMENIDMDPNQGTNMYTHVWFGGISFKDDKKTFIFKDAFGKPELVVVVYLRYGGFGKEAAPLAAQMVKKWREIKQKYPEKFN
mgnify:CR=1 FL=1